MTHQKPRILVYRNKLLPITETFIYNQSILLERYLAFFLGAKYLKGPQIPLPEERLKTINNGGLFGFLREILFKFFLLVPPDIVKWAESQNPVLIHAHFGEDGAMIMPLVRKLKTPFVVSFLGTDATMKDEYSKKSFLGRRLYLLRRDQLKRLVTKVIVPSEFLKVKVIEQGFSEEKIEIIHHGIDLSKFSNTNSIHEYAHILYVGRLIPRKGLNYLISALGKIKKEFPKIQLTVIGDGPMRSEYERQAKTELLDGYKFLGSQPHDVVRDIMSKAYIFSMPSITMPTGEAETFGLVFIEAQAMGVPVVSFASGGIPEVVEHGETGLLVEERDVEGLAEDIRKLLLEIDFHKKLSIQAQKSVNEKFDLIEQNRKLESLYSQLVSDFKIID